MWVRLIKVPYNNNGALTETYIGILLFRVEISALLGCYGRYLA